MFVKITASRRSYLFLQIMLQNKADYVAKQSNQQNLKTFNFMQNKKRLIVNILKVKTFGQTRINLFQHIKKSTAHLLYVKSIGHVKLGSSEDPSLVSQQKNILGK